MKRRQSILDHKSVFLILLLILIITTTFFAVYIREFIGFAVSVPAQAGYITALLIEQRDPTTNWYGVWGFIAMTDGGPDSYIEDGNPNSVELKSFIFGCLEPEIHHELYASLVDPSTLGWSSITPARPQWVDSLFGINESSGESATNTFTETGSVTIGTTTVTDVPMTYTKEYYNASGTHYNLGILNVSGDLVFFTQKRDSAGYGFTLENPSNFQMILPAPSTTNYYFFTDPNDVCPSGTGLGYLSEGWIYGYTKDNVTGQIIPNVTVAIATNISSSNGSGFYNMTTYTGLQYIVGLAKGYYIYTGLVNISFARGIEHNISLTPIPSLAKNGTIQGYVKDNRTNLPLADVTVHTAGTVLTTNQSGYYSGTVIIGNNSIVALKPNYEIHIGNVTILENQVTKYNISLEPSKGTVQGYTLDNATRFPISGVYVGIGDQSAISNSSGGFTITVRAGEHYIIGTKAGYENYASNITITPGATTYHNLTLVEKAVAEGALFQNGSIQGYVKDNTTSNALTGALVSLMGVSYLTGANGFYNISAVEGTHNLVAILSGYENYISEVNISAGNTTFHNISMARFLERQGANGTLVGNVTDSGGTVLEGVTISVAGQTTTSNATGAYSFDLREGTYNIVATKTGYDNYIGNATITPGNITSHNIIMETAQVAGAGSGLGAGSGAGSGAGKGAGTGVAQRRVIQRKEEVKDHEISLEKIVKKLRKGSFINVPITISNFRTGSMSVMLGIEGDVSPLIKLDQDTLNIDANSNQELIITILGNVETGVYEGDLVMSGDIDEKIHILVLVYEKEKLPIEALVIKLVVADDQVTQGDYLKYRVDIQNLLKEEEYNIKLTHKVINDATKKQYIVESDDINVQTSFSLLKNFLITEDFEPGEYVLAVDAQYLGYVSRHTEMFDVVKPFYRYSLFGIIPLWWLLVAVIILAVMTFIFIIYKRKQAQKQRYKVEVSIDELPKAGPRSAYVGSIAETNEKTYFDLDKFQIHTLLAGASGSGKTVAAEVLVEEALLKKTGVIVFDPSAVWTGFLRKCQEKDLLDLYTKFGMKKTDARGFNGNVHQIKDGRRRVNFKKYMKPGEINIFVIDKLSTKEIEMFVANAIREVFHANLPESPELKYIMVYDGIHTLLPKYGGSGKVFVQIERATREFRKWGVGLILLSQVISDFPPEVLANINTEIQTRTRDEKDLQRIKEEYGDASLKSIVKAAVGSGMVENSAYNKGKPYFVQFRPVLHSLKRITDKELENYNKYNGIIDDLEYQLQQLKTLGLDTFDLELELNLAKDKVKSGNFNLVDIYIDGLKPRIKSQWDKLGKTPKKHEEDLVSIDELEEELQATEKAKEKFEAEAPKAAGKAPKEPAMSEKPVQKAEQEPKAPSKDEKKEKGILEQIKDAIAETKKTIAAGNMADAKEYYKQIMEAYKYLSKDEKKVIVHDCITLQKQILGK
jgi:hypothetical protein